MEEQENDINNAKRKFDSTTKSNQRKKNMCRYTKIAQIKLQIANLLLTPDLKRI